MKLLELFYFSSYGANTLDMESLNFNQSYVIGAASWVELRIQKGMLVHGGGRQGMRYTVIELNLFPMRHEDTSHLFNYLKHLNVFFFKIFNVNWRCSLYAIRTGNSWQSIDSRLYWIQFYFIIIFILFLCIYVCMKWTYKHFNVNTYLIFKLNNYNL